jgi:hypothetical protein
MLSRTAIGLAVVLATASGSLAATKPRVATTYQYQNDYSPYGGYVRTDPDRNVRLNLQRDWDHGR